MLQNTPINQWRIKSREGKDFIKKAFDMKGFSVERCWVTSEVFEELLASISPSIRDNYREMIPFEGKKIVRITDD